MLSESHGMMSHHEDHHDGPHDHGMNGNHSPCGKNTSPDGKQPPREPHGSDGSFGGVPMIVEVPPESVTSQDQSNIYIGSIDVYNVVDAGESSPELLRYALYHLSW